MKYILMCAYVFEFLFGFGLICAVIANGLYWTVVAGNPWWFLLVIPLVPSVVAIAFLIMRTVDKALAA